MFSPGDRIRQTKVDDPGGAIRSRLGRFGVVYRVPTGTRAWLVFDGEQVVRRVSVAALSLIRAAGATCTACGAAESGLCAACLARYAALHERVPTRDPRLRRAWRWSGHTAAYTALTEQERDGRPCPICQQRPVAVVDHCHKTGQVRGGLCSPCNTALGGLFDDPAIVDRAAAYLRAGRLILSGDTLSD